MSLRFWLVDFPRRHPLTAAAGLALGIILGLGVDAALGVFS